MSWLKVKELNEKRQGILNEVRSLVEAGLTVDSETRVDALNNQERQLAKEVNLLKAAESAEKEVNELIGRDSNGEKRDFNVDLATRAWRKSNVYMEALSNEERAALTAAGSGFVPATVAKEFIEVRQTIRGPLSAGATEYVTLTAGPFTVPKMNDTSNTGERLATEVTAFALDVPPTDSSVSLPVYTYSSKEIPLSINFIRDSSIESVEAYIGQMASNRIYKAANAEFTVADGSSKPQGCVNGSTLGETAASPTAITYNEIINLLHSVDESYRDGAVLMFNDSVLKALRKLVDEALRPIWGPGNIAAGVPETLGGVPFVVNPNMPAMTAGLKPILYGNFKQGYAVRRVGNVVVHNIGISTKLQYGFVGALDLGGVVTDTTALKHLIMAAS